MMGAQILCFFLVASAVRPLLHVHGHLFACYAPAGGDVTGAVMARGRIRCTVNGDALVTDTGTRIALEGCGTTATITYGVP